MLGRRIGYPVGAKDGLGDNRDEAYVRQSADKPINAGMGAR